MVAVAVAATAHHTPDASTAHARTQHRRRSNTTRLRMAPLSHPHSLLVMMTNIIIATEVEVQGAVLAAAADLRHLVEHPRAMVLFFDICRRTSTLAKPRRHELIHHRRSEFMPCV